MKVLQTKEKQKELREKYKRSNKHIYAQMSRPLDKVYTAKGGAKYYNLTLVDQKDNTLQRFFKQYPECIPC